MVVTACSIDNKLLSAITVIRSLYFNPIQLWPESMLTDRMTSLFHILWSDSKKLYICTSLYLAVIRPKLLGQIMLKCKFYTGSTEITSEVLHTVSDWRFFLESSRPETLWCWFLLMCYLFMIGITNVCKNGLKKKKKDMVSLPLSTKIVADLFPICW